MNVGVIRDSNVNAWLQIDCSFFRLADGDTFVPWNDLKELTENGRDKGFLLCFYTFKAPGMRLRFLSPSVGFLSRLYEWLIQAEGSGLLRGFRPGRYEPESARFGGVDGAMFAHEWFDADTRAILDYATLPRSDSKIERPVFAALVINQLFSAFSEDGAELWDCWNQLHSKLSKVPRIPAIGNLGIVQSVFTQDFVEQLSDRERAILNISFAASERVAHAGALIIRYPEVALAAGRHWAVEVAVFHANRLSLPAHEFAAMSEIMKGLFL